MVIQVSLAVLENETIDEVTQSKQVIDADNHAAASSAATQTPANAANPNTLTSNGLPPSPSFITPFIATDHQRLVFRFIGYHLKPIKMHELNFQNSQKKRKQVCSIPNNTRWLESNYWCCGFTL